MGFAWSWYMPSSWCTLEKWGLLLKKWGPEMGSAPEEMGPYSWRNGCSWRNGSAPEEMGSTPEEMAFKSTSLKLASFLQEWTYVEVGLDWTVKGQGYLQGYYSAIVRSFVYSWMCWQESVTMQDLISSSSPNKDNLVDKPYRIIIIIIAVTKGLVGHAN